MLKKNWLRKNYYIDLSIFIALLYTYEYRTKIQLFFYILYNICIIAYNTCKNCK